MGQMVWIRGRLNRLESLGIEAATLASAGKGIDQTATHLRLSLKHLHPDAEEACVLGEAKHECSHRSITWLFSELLPCIHRCHPSLHPLFDTVESNQAAVGINDRLASAVQTHQSKSGLGQLLGMSIELGGDLNLATCTVKIGGESVVTVGQQNIR